MKKFLLSCVALAAGTIMAMAQELPAYPDKLDLTLNGEKELTGVTVSQTLVSESLTIDITGESDADVITMNFVLPDGWDYALVGSVIDGSGSPFNTRSSKWLPVSVATQQGYKEGYSFSFPVNGKENLGTIYLVKGDQVWEDSIDITFKVSNTGNSGDDQPDVPTGNMPEYPESLNLTLNGEKELPGVTVTQTMEPFDGEDYLTITITGESDAKEISINMATPEGWDGMLTYSDYDGESGEINPLQAKAPAKEGEDYWMPISFAGWLTQGNTIVLPVDGEEWTASAYLVKDDQVYMINIDVIFDVNKAGGSDEPGNQNPTLPDHLDYTLNGEKEIPGVKVRQLIDDSTQVFSITGECDADKITITFETPEGWDGLMIADTWGEGEISTVKTRGAELIPVKDILGQGFVEGNSITYVTDGEAQWGTIALIKGDMACSTFINYDFTVSKGGGSDVPGDNNPAFPESLGVTIFPDEGVEVEQHNEDGQIFIAVYGEIEEEKFDVVLDIPEGWDGFISMPDSEDVTVGDYNPGPRMKKVQEAEWVPIEEVLDEGIFKGNKFTFKANGARQLVEICLYKDGMVDVANSITLTANVKKHGALDLTEANQAAYDAVIAELDALQTKYEEAVAEIKDKNPDFDFSEWEEIGNMIASYREWAAQALAAANEEGEEFNFPFDSEEFEYMIEMMIMSATPAPTIPDSYVVTSSCPDLSIEPLIGEDFVVYYVTGECPDDEFTISVEVPEGWDDFIAYSDVFYSDDIMPLKNVVQKAMPTEWWPIEDMLDSGMILTNTLTFPADGEEHFAQLMLVKDGLADVMNTINIEVTVSKSEGEAVDSINAAQSTATYYDMNGNKINNPKAGMYIKVVDGKATKIIKK